MERLLGPVKTIAIRGDVDEEIDVIRRDPLNGPQCILHHLLRRVFRDLGPPDPNGPLRTDGDALAASDTLRSINFREVSNREEFWLDMVSPRLYSLLLHEGPFRRVEIDLTDISKISELFRNIIDFRSRFTSTHSSGVAASAAMLARLFGLTETEIKLMEVAGNLHDLGKLAIPNRILDKPGELTGQEMAIMKSHTYFTYSVINTIGGLQQIAEWAAYHHEKLDGTGYPFRKTSNELNIGSRIMAVADIFTALAEDRPYREGMQNDKITGILKDLTKNGALDGRIVNNLLENISKVKPSVKRKQGEARDFYNRKFGNLSACSIIS